MYDIHEDARVIQRSLLDSVEYTATHNATFYNTVQHIPHDINISNTHSLILLKFPKGNLE